MSKVGSQYRRAAPKGKAKGRASRKRRGRRTVRDFLLPGSLGIALIAGIAMAIVSRDPAVAPVEAPPPTLGSATAPVVLVEYGDYQCSACGQFARHVAPQLRAEYVQTGKLRIEWHDFAWYGQESTDAANAARCAGDQGKYWEYHDILYDNQRGTNLGGFAIGNLKGFARSLDIDTARFDSCVDQGTHLGAISADMQRVRKLGLRGTPSFFVNGLAVSGSPSAIRSAIEQALGG